MGNVRSKVKKLEIDINSSLSSHVLQLILSKLPVVNLPCCRLVCKAWNDMVLDYYSSSANFKCLIPKQPFFIALIRGQSPSRFSQSPADIFMYSIDFDQMKIVARFQLTNYFIFVNSCNGLLCLKKKREIGFYCVLNPLTNEYMEIPKSKQMAASCFYFYGLGFSLKTKQYKIIRVALKTYKAMAIDIFTLGHDKEWRSVDFTPFDICTSRFPSVYFNGALYWVGRDLEKDKRIIWRFDIEDEKFGVVSLPNTDSNNVYIQVFNDRLYANRCVKQEQPYETEMWMMQMNNGREESWIRRFVLKNMVRKLIIQLINIYENGDILLFVHSYCFCLYDPKNEMIKRIVNRKEIKDICLVHQIQSFDFDCLEMLRVAHREDEGT